MRIRHIAGGVILCCTGLVLTWWSLAVVIAFIKGVMQPLTILAGCVALSAALLGKREFRTINAVIAGFLLAIGGYGLYDEYYAVVDFFYGLFPLVFIGIGILSLVAGIGELKERD